MELCRVEGFSLLVAGGMVLHGWSMAERGDRAAGIGQMRRGLADWRATGALSHRAFHLALLAEALGRGGQTGEGLVLLAEALALAQSSGECFHEAELHRLRGALLSRQGAGD